MAACRSPSDGEVLGTKVRAKTSNDRLAPRTASLGTMWGMGLPPWWRGAEKPGPGPGSSAVCLGRPFLPRSSACRQRGGTTGSYTSSKWGRFVLSHLYLGDKDLLSNNIGNTNHNNKVFLYGLESCSIERNLNLDIPHLNAHHRPDSAGPSVLQVPSLRYRGSPSHA